MTMDTTAFALAGLGGFNAHGAGFLTAASDCGIDPDLVTATSGQIVVLADWLQGKNLEKTLIDAALARSPLAQLSALWLSLYGFDHLPKPHLIDGAYHRSCIVAELHEFDRVFVARPLAEGRRATGLKSRTGKRKRGSPSATKPKWMLCTISMAWSWRAISANRTRLLT
jgi:hypothetical protein